MMNQVKFICICCLFICMQSCINAQGNGDTPKAVLSAFEAKYPDESSPEWEIDAHGNYEAHFKKKGEKYRADFDKDGNWIETENSVKYSDLPDAVQETIKAKYDKDNIAEIEFVTHHSKGSFYDVEFKQKGKNHDVEIRPDGKVIGN